MVTETFPKSKESAEYDYVLITGLKSENAKLKEDMESYLETHFEIVQAITLAMIDPTSMPMVLERTQADYGRGGLYALAKVWTDEFEEKYKDIVWGEDMEYFDVIESFLDEKMTENNF